MKPAEVIREITREYFAVVRHSLSADEYTSLKSLDRDALRRWLALHAKSPAFMATRIGGPSLNAFEIRFDRLLSDLWRFWDSNSGRLLNALLQEDSYSIVLPLRGRLFHDFSGAVRRLGIYFDSVLAVDPLYVPPHARQDKLADPALTGVRIIFAHRLSAILKLESLLSTDLDRNIFAIIPDFVGTRAVQSSVHRFMLETFDTTTAPDVTVKNSELWKQVQLWHLQQQSSELLLGAEDYELGARLRRESITAAGAEWWQVLDSNAVQNTLAFVDDSLYLLCETWAAGIVTLADPIVYGPDAFLADWLRRDIASHHYERSDSQPVAAALLHERTDFLEAISLDSLKALRSEGVLEDLRRQLRVSRAGLRESTILDAQRYENAFLDQLFAVLADHQRRIEEVSITHRDELKRTLAGIGASVGIGALGLLLPPLEWLQIIAAGTGVVAGGKTVVDLLGLRRRQADQLRRLSNSPIGLLFDAHSTRQRK